MVKTENSFYVEVDVNSVRRRLIYDKKVFEDIMVKESPGLWSTTDKSIEVQLEEYSEETGYDTYDLQEAISNKEYEELMDILND